MSFCFFGNPLGWEITNGQFTDVKADGMDGISTYDDEGGDDSKDEPLPGQLSKRRPVDRIVGPSLMAQFFRSFRTTSTVLRARKEYNFCFKDGDKQLKLKGPSFGPAPELIRKNPSVPIYVPGVSELCILKGSELTEEQRGMGHGGLFSFFFPLPFSFQ